MTVRESLAAHPGREKTAPPPGRQPGAPDNVTRLQRSPRAPGVPRDLHDLRARVLLACRMTRAPLGCCAVCTARPAMPTDGCSTAGPQELRRLFGRLAAVFYAGCGALGLVTLPLPAPGSDTEATAAVYAAAVVDRDRDLAGALGEMAQGGQPGHPAARVRPHRPAEHVRRPEHAHLRRLLRGRLRVDRHGPSAAYVGRDGPACRRRLHPAAVPAARQRRRPGCRRPRSPSRSACWWGRGSRGA